jgi:superfamily II DNA or RNA helicase
MAFAFTEQDIAREFPKKDAERGRLYQAQGRVRDLAFQDGGEIITARVTGTAPRPYRVEIALSSPTSARWPITSFETRCACPVGIDCKHAAAVLFEVLARRGSGGRAVHQQGAGRAPSSDPLAGPVAHWLSSVTALSASNVPAGGGETLLYILNLASHPQEQPVTIAAQIVRQVKAGGYGKPRPVQLSTVAATTAPYVRAEDRVIARLLTLDPWRSPSGSSLPAEPGMREVVLQRLIATGRCHWHSKDSAPLTTGETRHGQITWRLLPDGRQAPEIETGSPALVAIPGEAAWYVDTDRLMLGRLELGLPEATAAALLRAPPVAASQAPALRAALAKALPGLALPLPDEDVAEEIITAKPVPCLRLASAPLLPSYGAWRANPPIIDTAELSFDYGGTIVAPRSAAREIRYVEGRRVLVWRRDERAEQGVLQRLRKLGLVAEDDAGPDAQRLTLAMPRGAGWPGFVHREVPALIAEGWRVEFAGSFRHRVIDAGGEWQAKIDEGEGGWWFSLDLGIDVEGRRVALLPLLLQALSGAGGAAADVTAMTEQGVLYARLDDGTLLALPALRLTKLLSILVELFDAGAIGADGRLDLSLGAATALAELEDALKLRWLGGERLRRLAERLAGFETMASVPVPEGFAASLRPYQQHGLDWLQFLREYGLGGILADDMGLGKTVQTLAHILTEKRASRLDRPCLVVCPTSLVPNWRAEAARFAPELKVVSLHGADRAGQFAQAATADLALTTYALLPRDEEALRRQHWHLVILDEAQAIKNPAAKATLVACRLTARHRLCLTGTPVENHLGDIWSQFAFLMPGLLGEAKRFTRLFRTPIERKGDADRQALLARRLKPFILRRAKAEVAAELPAKTLMTLRIELGGEQRDLYETVRLAMHEKVRAAVAARGLARSHIVILDALLKLRQVCCDPRLVKLGAAKRVAASAKLAHLKEMLPELIEEGRRILIFSQFTSMLDLIEAEVTALGIPFVDLRGDTKDRAMPVARFQRGEVPLFCLSLKAGGTGLNLTAADTVIHYDPWWNPAVEAQATDRAHRIGQDKPVFVYKLIAETTIEQRMLELQDRKAALANGLFDPEAKPGSFEAADLEFLFQPLA